MYREPFGSNTRGNPGDLEPCHGTRPADALRIRSSADDPRWWPWKRRLRRGWRLSATTLGAVSSTTDHTDPVPSLRERNKQRAREEIAGAALRLFRERGFDAVTVEDVLVAAGVSRRTFFRYFATKEDALLADYPVLNDRLRRALAAHADSAPLEAVRAALHDLAAFYVEQREPVFARSMVIRNASGPGLAARNLELLAQWESLIAESVARSIGRSGRDLVPRLVGTTTVGAFRSSLAQWVIARRRDLHQLLDEALDIVIGGLDAALEDA